MSGLGDNIWPPIHISNPLITMCNIIFREEGEVVSYFAFSPLLSNDGCGLGFVAALFNSIGDFVLFFPFFFFPSRVRYC